jgi:hypothetical protein
MLLSFDNALRYISGIFMGRGVLMLVIIIERLLSLLRRSMKKFLRLIV